MFNGKWLYIERAMFRLPENFTGDLGEAFRLFLDYNVKNYPKDKVRTTAVYKLSDYDAESASILAGDIDNLSAEDCMSLHYSMFEDDRTIVGYCAGCGATITDKDVFRVDPKVYQCPKCGYINT